MSGYVPLFSSLTTGSLCGRWPDIGLWPIVLSLSDRHGIVDVTPAYLANITGLPIADVVACMARFCEPDPVSRSGAESGARLVLLDEHRTWGWRIVNHSKYREKARLMAKDAARTESGKDKERKQIARQSASPDVPRSPPDSPSQTKQHNTKKEEALATARAVVGLDVEAFDRWIDYRAERKPAIKPASMEAAARELAAFGEQQSAVVRHSIANGYQGLFAPKSSVKSAVVSTSTRRAQEFPA